MKYVLILILTLTFTSCARDNPRLFGGINTDFKNENQIVLSYDTTFELGDILKDTYKIAEEHCKGFEKKAILTAKQGNTNPFNRFARFTTLSFECKK